MRPDRAGEQQSVRIGALIAGLGIGVAIALAAISALFPRVPTSISRAGRILEAISDRTEPPRLVVLGNSIAMSGIDSGQLERELGSQGPSYNLSYQGQSLVESYLLQAALGCCVEVIVQLVQVEPRGDAPDLARQKYNNLYMRGYRPSPDVIEKLREIYGTPVASILETPDLLQRIAARWSIQQLADLQVRRLFLPAGARDFVQSNLTLPVPYARPISNGILDRRLEPRIESLTTAGYRLDAQSNRMLETMLDESQLAGQRHIVVFAPLHPKLRGVVLKDALRALAAYGDTLEEREHVQVVDATSALSQEDFHDEIHPTVSGARRITSMIARRLVEKP